jgi:hypothetical protein
MTEIYSISLQFSNEMQSRLGLGPFRSAILQWTLLMVLSYLCWNIYTFFFAADHLLLLLLDWSTKLQWVKHVAWVGFGMVVKDKLKRRWRQWSWSIKILSYIGIYLYKLKKTYDNVSWGIWRAQRCKPWTTWIYSGSVNHYTDTFKL